jgi:polar amino acid transport system permease protein
MAVFTATATISTDISLLLIGAGVTVGVSVAAIALGFLLAMPICVMSLSPVKPIRIIGDTYVSIFRGVPLLIQLLVLYYLLPFIGLGLPPLAAGVLALGLCTSAYQAENLRGGIKLLGTGQAEAARSFGYSDRQLWVRILFPQAIRLSSPMIINEMISILKTSSLVSAVGIADLTRVSQNIVARTMQPITWYCGAALIYLVINLALAVAARMAARRVSGGRQGAH